MLIKGQDQVSEWLDGEIELQQAVEVTCVANVFQAYGPFREWILRGCHATVQEVLQKL